MTTPDDTTTPPQGSGEPPTPVGYPPAGQQAYPPYPPYAQPGQREVQAAYAQPYPSAAPTRPAPQAPPHRRRSSLAWLWWLVGIVVAMFLIGSFAAMLSLLGRGSSGGIGASGNVIAVIPFDGTIAGSGTSASTITPENFLKLLERAEDDSDVKAIVLRVNSPGGTVAASEEIATYVKESTKPVVISVGDVDASGAYMVSSQADKIVAGPGSAIGSIGVIMEVPNAAGLLDKLGVKFKVITAGKYKDAGSPFRDLTPTETAMLQGQIDQVYGQFIDIVAEGRKLPRSEVASMATGWAWNGQEAQKLHLVDQIGTYKDALKTAAKLGGVEGDYREDVYTSGDTLSGLLSTLLGIESQLKAISANSSVNPASVGGTTLAK